MGAYTLESIRELRELVGIVHQHDEPVVVLDGEDECLIAMRPSVFERILFDSDLLNCGKRETLHV